MGRQVTKNAAVLEWKQVMLQAMQDAKRELCAADGQTRLQVSTSIHIHGRECSDISLNSSIMALFGLSIRCPCACMTHMWHHMVLKLGDSDLAHHLHALSIQI